MKKKNVIRLIILIVATPFIILLAISGITSIMEARNSQLRSEFIEEREQLNRQLDQMLEALDDGTYSAEIDYFNNLSSSGKHTSEDELKRKQLQNHIKQIDSLNRLNEELRAENEGIRNKQTANANNNEIILGFKLKMTQAEFNAKRQALIRSGKLELWDDINYSAVLFSNEEMIDDKSFGRYSIPVSYRIELRYNPLYQNNKLVSWELPVWSTLSDNNAGYTRSTTNIKEVVKYFIKLYGNPTQVDQSAYKWISGNLEVNVVIKTVSKAPYGSEKIPVITFRDNTGK